MKEWLLVSKSGDYPQECNISQSLFLNVCQSNRDLKLNSRAIGTLEYKDASDAELV